MEQRNNLVLRGTETFSRGALDNVALDSGSLVLDSVAGRYLPYGSYTTPELAMPAFCNLNVSWNASAPHNTLVEVRCRVYAGSAWTSWMSFGKWAPDYPRCSIQTQSEDGLVFLMGDTITVAVPGGGTGIQLQVNLSTNDEKATPAVRLLAAAARPLAWEKQNGLPLNRQLYLPEYCLSVHDPSFGQSMDLPLILAALMNRWGEDILPEEVAYLMEDMATGSTANAAFAAAAAGCCGYPCWQAWMDLKDLRAQIHDGCSVAVQVENRTRNQREPVTTWMGLRGFWHDATVMADFVLLNDPFAENNGAVNRTMALADFMRYFTGRAIALRPKLREAPANRPRRIRCELERGQAEGEYYFMRRGRRDPLPDSFAGWVAYALYDGVAHATTAHRTFCRMERTAGGGILFPPRQLEQGGKCSVYAVDQSGSMRVAELRLTPMQRPVADPAQAAPETARQES
ncbi:MAG: hypothetical protein ACI4JC_06575 [Faecalibacterium sp.]